MATQNLLRFLLLVMLMMRIVLATVCWWFGSWGLVKKLNFCSDFEHKVWSRFWSWSSDKILMLGQDSDDEIWSRFVFELVTWFKEVTLVYQGLQAELNLRVRCAFGNVFCYLVLWRCTDPQCRSKCCVLWTGQHLTFACWEKGFSVYCIPKLCWNSGFFLNLSPNIFFLLKTW